MKIGDITIEKTAALAPMAGVADKAFRQICREYGCAWTVGEMTSAKGLIYKDRNTARLLALGDAERPAAIQLFGSEPEVMAQAAVLAMEYQPDVIDINMGCPAPKVTGNGGGSVLMRDPVLAGKIIRAVAGAVPIPVTVKIRKGWDADSVNAVEMAKIAQDNGAQAITIHGRTRAQMYTPPVDYQIIKEVKKAVKIPVIGNGDITDIDSARRMYEETGVDLIMIGRGAQGRPWLFQQIRAYFLEGKQIPEPSPEEKMNAMLRHIRLMLEDTPEPVAIKEARKHAAWYMRGMRGAAALRRECYGLETYRDVEDIARRAVEAMEESAG